MCYRKHFRRIKHLVGCRSFLLGVSLATTLLGPARGQQLVNPKAPEVRPAIQVLEDAVSSGRGRKDNTLSCRVERVPPIMNFSFRYQAGYRFQFPMRQFPPVVVPVLEITRVTSSDDGEQFYFLQRSAVPEGPRGKNVVAEMGGGFFVGEGSYEVDSLLLDEGGRRCYQHWKFRLRLNDSQREMAQLIEPGTVEALVLNWREASERERPYRISVFLHVAPFSRRSVRLNLFDESMLFTTIRSLLDATPFRETSIHAISLHQQRELLHIPEMNRRAFFDLSTVMEDLEVGTIGLDALSNPGGYLDLLADLVNQDLSSETPPDAIVFIGGNSRYTLDFRRDRIEKTGAASTEFFYLHLSRFQQRRFRNTDSIAKLTKGQGGKVFRIYNPKQFAEAIRKMEEILGQAQATRSASAPPAPRSSEPVPRS